MRASRARHDHGEGEGPQKVDAVAWDTHTSRQARPPHSFLRASIRSPVAGWVAKKPPPPVPSLCMSQVKVSIMTSFG